jgi:hypothetical protein
MTDLIPRALQAITVNAVVEPGAFHPEGCRQLRLHYEHGTLEAYTWTQVPPPPLNQVHKAVAYMVSVGIPSDERLVVTRFDWASAMDTFTLIPEDLGLADDVVYQCREAVDMVASSHLRQFLSDAFAVPDVFHGFWTTRGRYTPVPGGLAQEAVSLAHSIGSFTGIGTAERDAGIVHALLRDVGLIWCRSDRDSYPGSFQSLVALSKLTEAMDVLRETSAQDATDVTALLCSDHRPVDVPFLQSILDRTEQLCTALREQDRWASTRNPALMIRTGQPTSAVIPFPVAHVDTRLICP